MRWHTWEYWHHGAYMTRTVLLSRRPSSSEASWSCESCCTLLSLSQRSRTASCSACSAALATTLPECSPHSLPVASCAIQSCHIRTLQGICRARLWSLTLSGEPVTSLCVQDHRGCSVMQHYIMAGG